MKQKMLSVSFNDHIRNATASKAFVSKKVFNCRT